MSTRTKKAPSAVISQPSTPVKTRENVEDTINVVATPKGHGKTALPNVVTPAQHKDSLEKNSKDTISSADDHPLSPDSVKRVQVPSNVTAVYKTIHKATGTLGGNGYNGAIYGELTVGSMQKVINVLKEKCNMTNQSRFIDVGAGLGKPNFHAAQDPQVRVSLGIELEEIRWQVILLHSSLMLKIYSHIHVVSCSCSSR